MSNKLTHSFRFILALSIINLCIGDVFQFTLPMILPNNSYIELNDYILNIQHIPEEFGDIDGTIHLNLVIS